MQEVLAKVNELVGFLQQRISYYSKGIGDNEDLKVKLNRQDQELVAKATDLLSREEKVKAIENIVALRDDAVILKGQANDLAKSVQKEKDEFNKWSANERVKMAKDLSEIVINKQKVANELAMIQKEWFALKKEQKTWKDNFYKGLQNVGK